MPNLSLSRFVFLVFCSQATETAVQSSVLTDNFYTTTGVLTVKAAQADGGSQYTCKATGDMMMTPDGLSASTSLNVQCKLSAAAVLSASHQ